MAASRFLATTLCGWTEQTVSVTGAPTGSLRRRPRTTGAVRLRVVLLAVIGYLTVQGRNVFEEFGQSSVVRVRVELVRGMRDMVVDVMEQNSVEGAARGRDQLRGSWTSTTSVPLQERQPALRVEKVAHCVRHGSLEVSRTCRAAARAMETLERLRTLKFPVSRHWCVVGAPLAHQPWTCRPSRSAFLLSRSALRPRALPDFPMCR